MIEELTGDAYRGCEEAEPERLADGRIFAHAEPQNIEQANFEGLGRFLPSVVSFSNRTSAFLGGTKEGMVVTYLATSIVPAGTLCVV